MPPTPDDCHPDRCDSPDHRFARLVRLWHAEPFGLFSEYKSNHAVLRVATEFLICRIIKRAANPALHEYWSDGVEFIEFSKNPTCYYFGGACIFSDRHCNWMWLAPYELTVHFATDTADMLSAVSLRLGHAAKDDPISKAYEVKRREYRLYTMAHALYGARPNCDADWAVALDIDPYLAGESCRESKDRI